MLHKKFELDTSSTRLREGDAHLERDESREYRISDQEAVRCALSIPEEFVPTPHKEFIKDLEVQQETKTKRQIKKHPMISTTKPKPSIQNGGGEGEYRIINKTLLVRERERKLRSAFAKYKKWDEAERCKVELLDDNKIMVNNVVMDVNHSDYIKEQDVTLDLDEDYRTCSMPPLPTLPSSQTPVTSTTTSKNSETDPCTSATCRLGCICESIKRDPVVRTHCGKPRCFFECTCQQSMFNNGDDGDIRSRLRPRVSLLNWRFMESAERDKDPPPVNYRQLERGVAVYPRMRRVAVAPQRFRNEYIMSSKFKDTFNRERRKPVVGISKFIRKPPTTTTVKRDSTGSIYRRNYIVKPSAKQKENSVPSKMNVRPCTVTLDPLKTPEKKEKKEDVPQELAEQKPLEIPNLIKIIQRDAMIVLMGEDSLCFVTFTLQFKHPKAVVYKEVDGDRADVPWLYLPFPSSGESWLFHPIQYESDSTFTCIPEINCLIPSMALRMHVNMSNARRKTVALKMLWVGQDSKKRQGNIYILPALQNVLICGPFPHYLMTTRFNSSFHQVDRIVNVCSMADHLNSARFPGDPKSWNHFFTEKKERISKELQDRVKNSTGILKTKVIPANVIMAASGYDSNDSSISSSDSEPEKPGTSKDSFVKPPERLTVSWNDVSNLLSVQP